MPENAVPYIVYEGEQARNERHIRRLIIALIITVLAMFISNGLWLWAWMQYDYTSEEITVDGGDVASYIGRDGDIYNAEDKGAQENSNQEERFEGN